MSLLVQFGVWRDGKPVQLAREVRSGFEAVGRTVGSIAFEDRTNGVWLVEVDEELAQELMEDGFVSLEAGDWLIEAEMP